MLIPGYGDALKTDFGTFRDPVRDISQMVFIILLDDRLDLRVGKTFVGINILQTDHIISNGLPVENLFLADIDVF